MPRLLLLLALVLGCPKEGGAPTDSGEATPAPRPTPKAADPATRDFVARLLREPLQQVTVAAEGVAVVYDEWTLTEDGRYAARASVRLGDEPYACKETGRWALDDGRAESAISASIAVHVESTDCAGRNVPIELRFHVAWSGDDVVITEH
jgi:hypothetical protein